MRAEAPERIQYRSHRQYSSSMGSLQFPILPASEQRKKTSTIHWILWKNRNRKCTGTSGRPRPKDFEGEPFTDFHYASELVEHIKARGDFCVGGACYPEGHVDAHNKKEDITYLKKKVDAGCDYLTTQMFFDNNIYYNFLYRVREKGITVPIIPGIMPITRASQVKTACTLAGTNMPERFRNLVDCFGDNPKAMQQAGIAYATDQIIDLIANGIHNIHVYSMNKPEVAAGIQKNLSEIIHD